MRPILYLSLCTILLTLATQGLQAEPKIDPGSDSEHDPIRFTLTLNSALSPYERVRYEIKVRRTPITTLTKTLVGGYGELFGLGLLTRDDLRRVILEMEGCDLSRLLEEAAGDLGREAERGYWELELELDGEHLHVFRDSRNVTPDTYFWCVSEVFFSTYQKHGTPVPFRNRFFDPGEYGELYTDSTPHARVFINGRETGLETPIQNLPLLTGVHDIRFVNEELGIDRLYDVTIMEGYTTRLIVDLR